MGSGGRSPDEQMWDPADLAEAGGIPHLEVLEGPLPRGRKVERLHPGLLTLGRGVGVDFLFDVEGVSRKHAKITLSEDGSVTVYDLGSTNGTFVNGRKIEIWTLRPGDQVTLGEGVTLRFDRADPRYRQRSGPAGAGRDPIDRLSAREREIASLVAQGMTNAEIAAKLGIRPRTVGTHLSNIYAAVGVPNRTALARRVMEREFAHTEQCK